MKVLSGRTNIITYINENNFFVLYTMLNTKPKEEDNPFFSI